MLFIYCAQTSLKLFSDGGQTMVGNVDPNNRLGLDSRNQEPDKHAEPYFHT